MNGEVAHVIKGINAMTVSTLVICVFLPLGCITDSINKIITPFGTGTWSGTFAATFLHGSQSKTGTIAITFRDSTYRYSGDYVIIHGGIAVGLKLNWGGKFRLKNAETMYFQDAGSSSVAIDPRILGLDGDYHYSFRGKTLTASNGDTLYPISLVLKKAD